MKTDLIPAIIQDAQTRQVLMLGYVNEASLQKTRETGEVWFWSRSKNRLWKKGETSGNTFKVISLREDCDHDALLVSVIPSGPACHTGSMSCFSTEEEGGALEKLFSILQFRQQEMGDDSYTASLLRGGQQKICEKIEEESSEVITAAKGEGKQRLIEESVDLVYHLFVLLVSENISFEELSGEIKKRMR